MAIVIPFQDGDWSYIGVTDGSQVATYVNPATDKSSWAVGAMMMGWNGWTDQQGHAQSTELPHVNTGQLGHVFDAVIRRTMPPMNNIVVTVHGSNYLSAYADGTSVGGSSTGNPFSYTIPVSNKSSEWELAFYINLGNGATTGGLDAQVEGDTVIVGGDDPGTPTTPDPIGTPLPAGTSPVPLTTGQRKPPSQRDPEYARDRHGRSLQSMAPGTATGRIHNASPTTTDSTQYLALQGAISDATATDNPTIVNWADEQFTLSSGGSQVLQLSYLPIEKSTDVKLRGSGKLLGIDYTVNYTTGDLSILTPMDARAGDVVDVHYMYKDTRPLIVGTLMQVARHSIETTIKRIYDIRVARASAEVPIKKIDNARVARASIEVPIKTTPDARVARTSVEVVITN